VEDWFQVSAFAPYIPRAGWDAAPRRVERNVDRLLALLDEGGARATFFTLGWVAERHPGLVRRIAAAGHEVASHGYAHERATALDRRAFEEDVRRARAILEDQAGAPVHGYRAPSFSIGPGNAWAFDVLHATGHRYSSSVYPVRHDHYGTPDAPRFAHAARDGLTELPVSTARVLARNWPAGGGGYFRLMPYRVSRWMIRRVNRRDRQPAIFYCHPWEIDPGQPRVPNLDARTRFRHYLNLDRTEARLARLLRDFSWDRIDRVFPGAVQ
jgi:polysaccharide deacetylase family protein (PEP-CTERM system associated)